MKILGKAFAQASWLWLIVFPCFFFTTSCSLMEIKKQTTLADNLGTIKGKIDVVSEQKGSVIICRFWNEDGIPVLQRKSRVSDSGEYELPAMAGEHYIAAFIDQNRDGMHQPQEHGMYFGDPSTIKVAEKQTVTLPPITISGPFPAPATDLKPIDKSLTAWRNIGVIVSLDDSRFTLDYYRMGLWRPFDFLETAEGGLFFLQPFSADKIPVIFIHGVLGGPTVWETTINNLDNRFFQPWVLYYPSGLRLESISDYLVEAITRLQEKHHFKKFYVVAHSMGGLVARSFVKKYVETNPENGKALRLVMTVNSAMAGMDTASLGVKYSPIIVPSWRDVETDSKFLQRINDWNWPKGIPLYLVISYQDGKSDDGVVPLQSQAQLKLQLEASHVYVFNDEHTATINDPIFHETFNRILHNQMQQ